MKKFFVLVMCSIICVPGFAQEAVSESIVPNALLDDGAGIQQAVKDGNCSYLYDFLIKAGQADKYTGDPQNETGNKTIRNFITQAHTALRSYTNHDTRTDI